MYAGKDLLMLAHGYRQADTCRQPYRSALFVGLAGPKSQTDRVIHPLLLAVR
jgi:hypothetical protein